MARIEQLEESFDTDSTEVEGKRIDPDYLEGEYSSVNMDTYRVTEQDTKER